MTDATEQDDQKIIIDDASSGARVMAWFTNGAPQINLSVGSGEERREEIDLTYREAKALGKWLCRRVSAGEKAERRVAWGQRFTWLRPHG